MNTSAQACAQALIYVRDRTRFHVGTCDHVVALENGLQHSGFHTAEEHFYATPSRYRHGLSTPPPGALVFWTNGNAGHIALSLGGWRCASTDIVSLGHVNVVPIDYITQRWGQRYRGWTDAWYGSQGVRVIGPPPPTPPPLPTPTPVQIGSDEMFMYLSTFGYAVLVEGGKQVKLDPTTANALVGDTTHGHLDGPAPTYVKTTAEQEVLFAKAWGAVIHD